MSTWLLVKFNVKTNLLVCTSLTLFQFLPHISNNIWTYRLNCVSDSLLQMMQVINFNTQYNFLT